MTKRHHLFASAYHSATRKLGQTLHAVKGGISVFAKEAGLLLKPDLFSATLAFILLFLFLPTIGRHAADGLMLATFVDDEALITMQLDGMTVWPYGNPATYLGMGGIPKDLPEHWNNFNYQNLPYYGGFYLDLAFLIWMPLKLLGCPLFPTAPIILRALSLIFTICTVLATYNIARSYFGRIGAVIGALFIVTETYFGLIGTIAHPDSLLFFLAIVALAVCIRHARDGAVDSLIAVGIAAGLAQGAKMGGPLLIPITVLSVGWGAKRYILSFGWLHWLGRCFGNGILTLVVAIAVFVLTTPYAILDDYFFYTWQLWSKSFAGVSPISPTTFWDWASNFQAHVGMEILLMTSVGGVLLVAQRRDPSQKIPQLLTATLALTVFLWYAIFQKFWVQLQYLIIPFWFVAMLAGTIADRILSLVPPVQRPPYRQLAALSILVFAGTIGWTRFLIALNTPARYLVWREAPQLNIGDWALRNIPSDSNPRILIDAPTYFDSRAFPNLRWNGGPIRYSDLMREMPDYIALTRYAGGNWQSAKISGPKLDYWDTDYSNMRLYQDLLGVDPLKVSVDTTETPFARHMTSLGWMSDASNEVEFSSKHFGIQERILAAALSVASNNSDFVSNAAQATELNRHVALFKIDHAKFAETVPVHHQHQLARAFASSSVPSSPPQNVTSSSGQTWQSAKQGPLAVGEFVGLEFPYTPVAPREVMIKWVAWAWCPQAIEIEYSEDGSTWLSAGTFPVTEPADPAVKDAPGTMRWEETFKIPNIGPKRYWRINARSMSENHFFGLEQIRFR